MDHQLTAILTLAAIVLAAAWVVRFIFELVRLPSGTLSKALAEAHYDSDEDDASNPILRHRRIGRAQGFPAPIR